MPPEGTGGDAGGGTRPSIHSLYWVGPGYFDQAYATAAGIADDPNNTLLQKAGGYILAAAESPLKLLEDTGRSILNFPAAAYISGQYVGAAISDQDSFQRWNDIAQASGAFGQALMGATIVGGAVEGTVTRSVLSSDAGFAAPEVVPDSAAVDATQTVGDAASGANPQSVTVYRVEGTTNQRLAIDDAGNVSLVPGNNSTIWLNFGEKGRAVDYMSIKVSQGLPGAQLKSFEIDPSFLEQIQNDAVPEQFARSFPNSPIISADPFPNQFGIRQNQFQQLLDSIYQGSGRNVPPGGN